ATPGVAKEPRGVWARDNEVARRAGLLHLRPDGSAEVALLVEGMTCGACVWLLESWLAGADGVRAAEVNLALRRARVRIDPRRMTIGALLDAIGRVGYVAHAYDPARRD